MMMPTVSPPVVPGTERYRAMHPGARVTLGRHGGKPVRVFPGELGQSDTAVSQCPRRKTRMVPNSSRFCETDVRSVVHCKLSQTFAFFSVLTSAYVVSSVLVGRSTTTGLGNENTQRK